MHGISLSCTEFLVRGLGLSCFVNYDYNKNTFNFEKSQTSKLFNINFIQSTYTVQDGDNCYKIATKYGITLDQLLSANKGLNCDILQVGQILNIPIPPEKYIVHNCQKL